MEQHTAPTDNIRILLASTSTVAGSDYLAYLKPALELHFSAVSRLLFVPYARPGGISHEAYSAKAADFFKTLSIEVDNLAQAADPAEAIQQAQAIFTGGGNTFLLVKTLHEHNLMELLGNRIRQGIPYLGTSAGANIAGQTMCTTNDMPIVYPPSFTTLGLVPFNINPHFISGSIASNHMGETRETRIGEYLTQNTTPVVALPEGSWVVSNTVQSTVAGQHPATVFERNKPPYQVAPGDSIPL